MIYFTHRNFKVQNGELAYLLFQSRRRNGHYSTLKFDPISYDLLCLFVTEQTAYISFQQVRKGVNFQR